MKRVAIVGKRKAGLVEAPTPEPREDWALVKVHAAPMCAEYKSFLKGNGAAPMGHEAAGEVVRVAQPCGVEPGERVVVMPTYPCGRCRLCVAGDYIHCQNGHDFEEFTGSPEGSGTMAQYVLKPAWLLPRIPDGVSYEHASLACCGLGPSFGAFQGMGLTAFDTVLVAGAGPVGLGAMVNARFRGARVIVTEPVPWRAERAAQMGAGAVLDPTAPDVLSALMELTGGRGVDCAVDCAGSVDAQRLCIDAAAPKGRVAFVGECREPLGLRASPDMIRKGLTLLGAWHYNLADFPRVMQVIQESPLIDLLISHVMPMSSVQEAFELSASHQCAKVVLQPWHRQPVEEARRCSGETPELPAEG
jgi:threonine dehydrogenase-like Zn-dependent dehydrogenase